jgi:hypothetical protein
MSQTYLWCGRAAAGCRLPGELGGNLASWTFLMVTGLGGIGDCTAQRS